MPDPRDRGLCLGESADHERPVPERIEPALQYLAGGMDQERTGTTPSSRWRRRQENWNRLQPTVGRPAPRIRVCLPWIQGCLDAVASYQDWGDPAVAQLNDQGKAQTDVDLADRGLELGDGRDRFLADGQDPHSRAETVLKSGLP